ncbi:hypothetical protein QAD02_013684 [Eretmocerus hayati]|uniref:Uncharacterized protein n=1 Tax=Eretmocerus hayati TaxID=131215 RepID=A0ACC2P3F6_9HYME|nr:hypothetical protein QAD02_013684 [Eretmocerus hayati]
MQLQPPTDPSSGDNTISSTVWEWYGYRDPYGLEEEVHEWSPIQDNTIDCSYRSMTPECIDIDNVLESNNPVHQEESLLSYYEHVEVDTEDEIAEIGDDEEKKKEKMCEKKKPLKRYSC